MRTPQRRAAQSIERSGQPRANPAGLPYGTGSLQMRGRTWWMIYRDPEGRTIQKNTRTDNRDWARRMLVERALETARTKVLALEGMLDEAAQPEAGAAHASHKQTGQDKQLGSRYRSVRHNAPGRRDGGRKNRGGNTKCPLPPNSHD